MWRKIFYTAYYIFVVISIFIILHYSVRIFIADRFRIPTSSMEPTLKPGDNIIVNKLLIGARIYKNFNLSMEESVLKSWRTRGFYGIKHNDIVIFNRPIHNGNISFVINDVFCKRIIGLPGDSVGIINGFYKNNHFEGELGHLIGQQKLSETPNEVLRRMKILYTTPYDSHINWDVRNFGPMYIPRKGDIININPTVAIQHKLILEWETGKDIIIDWADSCVYADNLPIKKHRFLHNYYFMAGDNVINSSDSRYWGLVPEEYIVGVVSHIIYSQDIKTGEIRWERIGKKL